LKPPPRKTPDTVGGGAKKQGVTLLQKRKTPWKGKHTKNKNNIEALWKPL